VAQQAVVFPDSIRVVSVRRMRTRGSYPSCSLTAVVVVDGKKKVISSLGATSDEANTAMNGVLEKLVSSEAL